MTDEPINISDMVARIEFPPMDLENDFVVELPHTTMSFSGFYDPIAFDQLIYAPQERTFEIWPKGRRWPWSPVMRGTGTFDNCSTSGGDQLGDEMVMTMSGSFNASTFTKGRLGWRAWARQTWAKLRHNDGGGAPEQVR